MTHTNNSRISAGKVEISSSVQYGKKLGINHTPECDTKSFTILTSISETKFLLAALVPEPLEKSKELVGRTNQNDPIAWFCKIVGASKAVMITYHSSTTITNAYATFQRRKLQTTEMFQEAQWKQLAFSNLAYRKANLQTSKIFLATYATSQRRELQTTKMFQEEKQLAFSNLAYCKANLQTSKIFLATLWRPWVDLDDMSDKDQFKQHPNAQACQNLIGKLQDGYELTERNLHLVQSAGTMKQHHMLYVSTLKMFFGKLPSSKIIQQINCNQDIFGLSVLHQNNVTTSCRQFSFFLQNCHAGLDLWPLAYMLFGNRIPIQQLGLTLAVLNSMWTGTRMEAHAKYLKAGVFLNLLDNLLLLHMHTVQWSGLNVFHELLVDMLEMDSHQQYRYHEAKGSLFKWLGFSLPDPSIANVAPEWIPLAKRGLVLSENPQIIWPSNITPIKTEIGLNWLYKHYETKVSPNMLPEFLATALTKTSLHSARLHTWPSANHMQDDTKIFHLAVYHGEYQLLQELLSIGTDINYIGPCSGSALYLSAEQGHLDIVQLLLTAGADVNILGGEFGTALNASIYHHHVEIVTMLLAANADTELVGAISGTPLQTARYFGYTDIVDMLYASQSNTSEHKPYRNDLPIEESPVTNTKDLLEEEKLFPVIITLPQLLDSKVDEILKNEMSLENQDLVELLLSIINDHDFLGTAEDYSKISQYLVAVGANINNMIDCTYGTVLQAAAFGQHPRIVQLLLEAGANPDLISYDHPSALQMACFHGSLEIVRMLLAVGANPNLVGAKAAPPLQAACYLGERAIIQLLLAGGADPNLGGDFYGTPLQAAASGGHKDVVQLLLGTGASANQIGGYYGTSLQAAAYGGYCGIVELLLIAGADVNIMGGYYGTALQSASYRGHKEIVDILLSAGADPNISGGRFRTALEAASIKRHKNIVQCLMKGGAKTLADQQINHTTLC